MISTQIGVVLLGVLLGVLGLALVRRTLRPRQTSVPKVAPMPSQAGQRALDQARGQTLERGTADRREVQAALAEADPVQGLVDVRAARRRREP